MAKIHPKTSMIMSKDSSSEREKYTVWMKSLVMQSNGCTVFNSSGEIVFRVDNYQTRGCREVFLMNSSGQVLYSIKRKVIKNLLGLRNWEGYKWCNNSKENTEGEWFQVRKKTKLFTRNNYMGNKNTSTKCLEVILGCNKDVVSGYKIFGSEKKSTFKIVNGENDSVLAEVVQKQSSTKGIYLGDDVFTLMVEPQIDQSLIMALVIVHGMINHKL